jgi:hypothetical protein
MLFNYLYRAHFPRLICLFSACGGVAVLTGCGGGGGGMTSAGQLAAEPTGGRWKTIVLSSSSAVSVPAPPALGSAQVTTELQEVRDLQKQRPTRSVASAEFWNRGATYRWNEIARNLVIKNKLNPPKASRLYALLSVAQYDALVAAYRAKYEYNRSDPSRLASDIRPLFPVTPDPAYPSEHAVVAAASAEIIEHIFPAETDFVEENVTRHLESRLWVGANLRSDLVAGDQLGRAAAAKVLTYAQTDGSDAVWAGTAPTGPGAWNGTNPLLPLWGKVKPWLMTASEQFRPAPPPAFGSAEFNAALTEVRRLSDTRTPEQLRIALFWADGAGTSTPPGHWNQIATDAMAKRDFNEIRTARALALMNMAMQDGGICCWDAKYAYWLIRPSQADPAITTPPGLPPFPAYTSGHSTFSGAAADVLGYIMPDQAAVFGAMANEAAISRVYGGIHYRFDSDVGLQNGRSIAELAIARGRRDGSP